MQVSSRNNGGRIGYVYKRLLPDSDQQRVSVTTIQNLMVTTCGKFVSSRVMDISEIRKQLCLFIEVLMFRDFGFLFNPVVVFPAAASA